ncbi:MAG: DegQ family serine endoprotease [Candidatus Manganitrophaceae bacterium]|nr:MAG: DegQ family serine endoprotease [Candidatus Manganitrophaceae bacterium]
MSDDYREVRPKRLVFSVFLIIVGIVIGITLVSEFHLLPFGAAVNDPQKDPQKPKPPAISQTEQTFVEISKSVTPAVVNISTTRVIKGNEEAPGFPFDDPFFRRFFGDEAPRRGQPRERRAQSLGSGVIVDPNGLIITNNHVVAKADEIKVVLGDKREFKGKLIGSDPKTDLAIIQIEAKDLPTVSWGNSDKLQVGEYVLAIGNPFGLNQTVTMGIVSAVGRANVGIADYEDFIQTDAAINPGNSGGAMVNTHGELVGINTAIFTQSGGYMGIGFAVPSNMAKLIVESLVKNGKVVRGWLGVSIQEITPQLAKEFGLKESKGALVGDVLPNSPAEKAGLKRGDVIVQYNGQTIENAIQLRNLVAKTEVGSKKKVRVVRDKKEKEVEITIEEQPKELPGSAETEQGEEGTSTALMGLEVRNLTPEIARQLGLNRTDKGVVITRIEQGSVAEEVGLQRGDLIMEVNRKPVRNTDDYDEIISKIKKDEAVLLLINRQGRTMFVTISP